MKPKSFSVLLLILFVFISCSKDKDGMSFNSIELNKDWQFKSADSEEWMTAEVPGSVHTDLMANNKIEDPFYRLNEHDVQWVDKKDWEYKTTFNVDAETLKKDKVELFFEGLDTYANVSLNGKKILAADNMFREWRVDCKEYLQQGENTLHVVLLSPINIGIQKQDELDYTIPVSDNDLSQIGGVGDKKVSVFTRKAGYHFGWDWGPRLVTSGIWKHIKLQSWDKGNIRNLFVRQNEITETSANLTAQLEIEAQSDFTADINISINNGEKIINESYGLKEGKNTVTIPFTINNPELWWPNGLGEQPLYNIDVTLDNLSQASTRIGLRTIEIVQEKDSVGSSFYFKVNGEPVFMKGANYIPQDVFLNRVNPDQYERVINSAVATNMNMLRIWGGGVYEKDIFYDLCDEKGILVWQDFMFACAMFPGDEAFLENVRQEAIDNVKRLRNHPSIALWCGNNECLSAWYAWGWKNTAEREQGKEVADKIWKAYDDNFHNVLPEVVSQYDSDRMYWASSPSASQGVLENWVDGDVHYWGVWWGQEPFANYREKVGRFMSEYGFQSFPELSTVKKYATEDDWDIFSDVMKSHQRSSIGNGTIDNYMKRDYREPKDFPMFLYVGQLLQAEGIKVAMEAHRKNMPFCMGSLYWQIDDCWPVASWSSIDYYGKWKAQHYFTKYAFGKVLVSPEIDEGNIKVYIVSDKLEDVEAELMLALYDFEGARIWENTEEITITANSSAIYFEIPEKEITKLGKKNNLLLHASVDTETEMLSKNCLYFLPPKDLDLPKPEITFDIKEQGGKHVISIRTDKLAKNVYLTTDTEGFFSDNYFDLMPGEGKTIAFEPSQHMNGDSLKLNVISLVDSY
jgi:beta-mannosidase